MSKIRLFIVTSASALIVLLTTFSPLEIVAQVASDDDPDLARIDIVEHLGDTLPLDLEFTDDHGEKVMLEQYFNDGKPVILVLGYYECPMLCGLVLNGLTSGLQELAWNPGDKFNIVSVSIDPEESYELAMAKKANYVKKLDREGAENGWAFLVGGQENSQALADAVGFKFFYDEKLDQYAHPAAVFVLTEEGVISRYLYGIELAEQDLRLSLLEASEGKIGNTVDRLILYCFQYDPQAKGYVVMASNVMKLGGVITIIVLAIFFGIMLTRERLRKRQTADASEGPMERGSRSHG